MLVLILSEFSSSVVKAVNVSIILDILNKSLFKFCLSSLSSHFLFETSTHKNVLTFLIETSSAKLSALLIKISIYKNCFVLLVCDEFELIVIKFNIISSFKSKLTAVNLNFSLLTINKTVNAEESALLIFLMNFMIIALFYDHLIDCCFSNIFDVCFCSLRSMLFFFSFSTNLTA